MPTLPAPGRGFFAGVDQPESMDGPETAADGGGSGGDVATNGAGPGEDLPEEAEIEDAIEELEELEDLVDSEHERRQVTRTLRVLERAKRPRLVGRFTDRFGVDDAGEALVGAVVFGIPMIVEDGTLTVGAFIATQVAYYALTVAFGLVVVVGILSSVDFAEVEADLLFGVLPRRLLGIVGIAAGTAVFLMTVWGRVSWATPWVATCQVTVTAVVMAIGAAIGDILPE